jgi:crooked neck
LVREANERQDRPRPPPKQKLIDAGELSDYQQRKRKGFEDILRRNRLRVGEWIAYAAWEESQGELQRARSIYERALDVNPREPLIYNRYVDMEMKHKNVNMARNLFDRVVSLLPRADQFWYKYTYMEEMLGNIKGARQVFERWMQWLPEDTAWLAYIKFERRYNELDHARTIYAKFVQVHPDSRNWIKWAKFEEEQEDNARVRDVFAKAIEFLGDELVHQRIFVAFAKFETKLREFERARVIYKFGLERLPKNQSEMLYKHYVSFEKQYGSKEDIEDVVLGKRRALYEEQVLARPNEYDAWFNYAQLEEEYGDVDKVRDVYERAIAQVPPTTEKRYWRRYVYLWIAYAMYEELDVQDMERARQVYTECLKLLPHKQFTFAKVWLLYAQFEVRRKQLGVARKTLGQAIGMCPKRKLFKGYIDLELSLREFDRCRLLYRKFLEYEPSNCTTWIQFADMEAMLGDVDRTRALFELAVAQSILDMPELLWKAFIDFEVEQGEWERARALYERLLERTDHVKVWHSYAQFELLAPPPRAMDAVDTVEDKVNRARALYQRAYVHMRRMELSEERVLLLESWHEFELEHGSDASIQQVTTKMPKVVKKRRNDEEYFDYIFPDDETQKPKFKLLEIAHKWKQEQQQ